jgi:hypothetical protein
MSEDSMIPLVPLALAVVLAGATAVYFAAKRAITIAELEITKGKLIVVRGGIAPPILADLRDIASRPLIPDLRIQILRASGRAEVKLTGTVSPEQAQRIRNVIGSVPLARLINAVRS